MEHFAPPTFSEKLHPCDQVGGFESDQPFSRCFDTKWTLVFDKIIGVKNRGMNKEIV